MIKLRGLEGLQKQLSKLSEDTQPKVLRSALREAFKPVLAAAQAKVPVDSGALRAGIVLATAKTKDGGIAAGLLIANNSAGLKQSRLAAAAFGEAQLDSTPSRRWHLTELGTAHSPPEPFLRPALEENADSVVSDFATALNKKIQNAIKRGGGK